MVERLGGWAAGRLGWDDVNAGCLPYASQQPFPQKSKPRQTNKQGLKSIRAFFEDTNGFRTSIPASAVVFFDVQPPIMSSGFRLVQAGATRNSLTMRWEGTVSDLHSGFSRYWLSYRAGTSSPPPNCAADGTVIRRMAVAGTGGAATAATTTVLGLTKKTSYRFRICAIDMVNNTAPGVLGTGTTLA
jgi:hypothetical protein